MTYVFVLGPYDSTLVGPFAKRELADAFRATVPNNFDAYVWTQAERDANEAEFGAIVCESPDTYGFEAVAS